MLHLVSAQLHADIWKSLQSPVSEFTCCFISTFIYGNRGDQSLLCIKALNSEFSPSFPNTECAQQAECRFFYPVFVISITLMFSRLGLMLQHTFLH